MIRVDSGAKLSDDYPVDRNLAGCNQLLGTSTGGNTTLAQIPLQTGMNRLMPLSFWRFVWVHRATSFLVIMNLSQVRSLYPADAEPEIVQNSCFRTAALAA
jgi:hypothetical protein